MLASCHSLDDQKELAGPNLTTIGSKYDKRGLLDSIPRLEFPRKARLRTIEGMVPALMDLPAGCRFNNRCPYRIDQCTAEAPPLAAVAGSHRVGCHRWRELPAWQEPTA